MSFTLVQSFGQADSGPKATFLTRFPFKQFSGGVMVVKATINNIPDSLNFILDTGSGGISLDSSTCAYYGIINNPSDTTITGMGGSRKVNFVFDQQLNLPGLSIKKLNFHVNDYDVLSSVYGEKIDGIIGYSFFSKYIAAVNFDNNEIEVYTPGEIEYPRGGSILRPLFTTLPILPMKIRDAKNTRFNFYFDTGAGLCFLMSQRYAKDSGILSPKRKRYTTQAEGLGGRLHMELTVVKQVKVGRYTFKSVPTFLYDDIYNVTSYPFVGGLLGNDILRRFNLIINYPQREIHIVPNSHYKDPFDYAYTGMAIYYVDGRIEVDDIIPGSPAEKAGLKKGDIVISVGNNISNNVQMYKALLQSASERIRIIVERNGEVMQLSIKPKSILR